MPYVWGYTRVSDELQLGRKSIANGKVVSNTSMETQEYAIRQWWEANREFMPGYSFYCDANFDGIFRDPAQAASKIPLAQRPQGSLMLSFVSPGDIIVVTDGRRLFRDPLDYYTTKAILKPRGVRFEYLNQPNTSWDTPEGQLLGGLFAILGQHETDLMSERQRNAYKSREERGIVTGRYAPLGYRKRGKVVEGKLVKFFSPCKRERWLIRIMRWMRKNDTKFWTRNRFRAWCLEHNIRRGPKGTDRCFYWQEFVVSPLIVEGDWPQQMLASDSQGYLRDRLPEAVSRVRKSRSPAERRQPKRVSSVPVEDLWNAPAGTTASQLRRRQYLLQEQPEQPAASPPPCS